MSIELLSFLQLVYSFAKQYISWYERTITLRQANIEAAHRAIKEWTEQSSQFKKAIRYGRVAVNQ